MGLAAFALVAAGILVTIMGSRQLREAPDASIESDAPGFLEAATDPSDPDRPVYLHSVIAGGAYDAGELANAMLQDAVVKSHYRDLKPETVRAETVKKDRLVYVSYRKNDQVYWTRNRVLLRQGETILTDGKTEIRSRCGNCISERPQFPVADVEPDLIEFDRLVDDPSSPVLAAENAAASPGPGSFVPPLGQPAGGIGVGPASGPNGFGSSGGGGLGAPSPSGSSGPSGSPAGGSSSSREEVPPTNGLPPFGGGPDFPPGLIDPPPGLDDFDPNDPDNPGLPSDPDPPKIGSNDGGPGDDDSTGDDDGTAGDDDTAGDDGTARDGDISDDGGTPTDSGDGRSVPEPGMLLLVGGGAAIALLRRLHSRS